MFVVLCVCCGSKAESLAVTFVIMKFHALFVES